MTKLVQSHKVVASLPGTLQPSSVYYVRVGTGFDIYVTNSAGTIVSYPLNPQSAPMVITTTDPASPQLGWAWILQVTQSAILGFFGAMPIMQSSSRYYMSVYTADGIKRSEIA